ncbi:MAG: DUF4129 domain-containing protein [Planctomycetes bacterium]|nr:DUF4129 domain-containing protein [Planctomycetota bacterium]
MRLLFLLLLLGVAPAGSGHAADTVEQDLRKIFAKPEYHRWRRPATEDLARPAAEPREFWLVAQVRRLLDYLRRLIPKREPEAAREPIPDVAPPVQADGATHFGSFSLMGTVLLALAGGFLLFSIVRYLQWRGQARPPDAAGRVGVAQALRTGDALAFSHDEWGSQAERFRDAGQLRLAYRSLFLGLLSGLHAQGRIVFAPNRTNWQYVRGFRGGAADRRNLADLTDLFDRVWYGTAPVLSETALAGLRDRVGALLAGDPAERGHD